MTIEEMLHTPIISPSSFLTYLGEYDPKKNYKHGDVVIDENGHTMVYTGNGFDLICNDDSTGATVDAPSIKMVPQSCICCGAPLVKKFGEVKCEYCGTSYK